MKKIFLLIAVTAMFSFATNNEGITKKEKKFATKFLKDTKQEVEDAVAGLSEAQLKFKASPETWSVEDCLKHIAMTEQALWGMADGVLKGSPTPDKRSDVKMTDEEVIQKIENRTKKVKTSDPMKPENTPFKSASEALGSFKQSRDKLVSYVKDTKADLRNYVIASPMGALDAYQFILFISAHTNRHMQQIVEVKANAAFPAK